MNKILSEIKLLCKKYNIRPQKRKGQNFLIDRKVLDQIIQTANLSRSDLVLEIGPGFGVLTKELSKRAEKVVAVEIDRRLVRALKGEMRGVENIEIIEGDILKIFNFQFSMNFQFLIFNSKLKTQNSKKLQATPASLREAERASYKIIANLPYQITSPVLQKFLTQEPKPFEMILMVQKEVAERIVAKKGGMTFLSILVQFYAQPEIITYVSKKSFWPQPKIDSALLRLSREDSYSPLIGGNEKEFFHLVKIGFSNRRKQLRNNLTKGLNMKKEQVEEILKNTGLDVKVRAQDLGVEEWVLLAQSLK